MKWIKFSEQAPKHGSIIYINYKCPCNDMWNSGFCHYTGGEVFETEDCPHLYTVIHVSAYWIYAKGLTIQIEPPCGEEGEKE